MSMHITAAKINGRISLSCGLFGDFQHVVVGWEELFPFQPISWSSGELDSVIGYELEVPPCPFALQGTNGIL